ncbi:hypothetical protein Taro_022303 [Colocasia esculenta]|uniref:Uncharacterized protein n=1 Tax=Colocasia esculenta TaxID=4460 RepID=A0A843VAY8_COLES|nr:hypothetical protein [Colocasia esculenta]
MDDIGSHHGLLERRFRPNQKRGRRDKGEGGSRFLLTCPAGSNLCSGRQVKRGRCRSPLAAAVDPSA